MVGVEFGGYCTCHRNPRNPEALGESSMRKSDQEKSEIRRQIEARRRPEKDRSAHEAARGKKKMSLSDLSRNDIQDEHIQDIIHELDHQSD